MTLNKELAPTKWHITQARILEGSSKEQAAEALGEKDNRRIQPA